jgi:uncharacterized protein YjcR
MGKLNKLNDSDKTDIVTMYKLGNPLKVIANKYSCTSPTVATFLRAEGVTVRGKGKVAKKNVSVNPIDDQDETDFI